MGAIANAGFVVLAAALTVGCGGDQTSGQDLGPGGPTPAESQTFDEQIRPGDARVPDAAVPTVTTTARFTSRTIRTAPPVTTAPPAPPPATVAPEPVAEETTTSTAVTSTSTTATTSPSTTTTSKPSVTGDEQPERRENPPSTTTTTAPGPLHPGDLQSD